MNRFYYLAGLALIAAIGVAVPQGGRIKRQDADYEYESDYPAQDESEAALGLPSDSRSIRDNIVDEFTCDGKKKNEFYKLSSNILVHQHKSL